MGNSTMLAEFNVTKNKNRKHYFENPVRAGEKIFIIPDVVHLIKLFRTNILKYGLQWNHDGIETILDRKFLETMIERDTRKPGQIRRLPKLSINTHTRIDGMALQRVGPACQLLRGVCKIKNELDLQLAGSSPYLSYSPLPKVFFFPFLLDLYQTWGSVGGGAQTWTWTRA